ncbi:hypothetical protein CNR22_23880 [Sphingobacteriaceae bacterium]|nr:hypothetical protein CNR22_23880 [Sphingobacteriaceae bacterium]
MALNTTIYEKFRNAFEHKCCQLIVDAYQTSIVEKVIKLDWNENDISSELHQHIKKNPQRLKWKVSTNVEADIPKNIPKEKGFSDKFPRIDFRLTSFVSTYEFEYFFEAKNLKQNDSGLKRRYIDTGINNFVSKKYENGSLIGYLLEGQTNDAINGINSLLKKDKRNTETLILKSNKLIKTYYESNHSDIGVLKHLIFDFTNISS